MKHRELKKTFPPLLVCRPLLLAAALGGLALTGCARPTRTGRPVGPEDETAKQVPQMPQRPQPLPAKRVLEVAFTSNVAGEAEPCG